MDSKKMITYLFTLILVVSFSINAQSITETKKIYENAGITGEKLTKVDFTIQYLVYNSLSSNQSQIKESKPFSGNSVITSVNGKLFVSVFIKSSYPQQTKALIQSVGGSVSNIIQNILIADIPVDELTNVVFNENILEVETARYSESFLDESLKYINVDKIHNGENLPRAYKGKDVVVGVLDSGVDWTHPSFSNANGNRILYLWDMSDDTNPPAEFNYGTEYTKADLDQQNSNQIDDDGHGTHVASTAAGNAGGSEYPLDGVAPEADIVFVKGYRNGPGFADTDIVNGCDYIFKRAEQLGKPAVINLSLGGLIGNTGTTLYEQALTNLVGPGKLIVAAAGNEGDNFYHLQYEMSGSSIEEASETYWEVEKIENEQTFLVGYPQSDNYTFGIKIYSADLSTVLYTSPAVSFNQIQMNVDVVVNSNSIGTLNMSGHPNFVDPSLSGEPYLFGMQFIYESDADFSNYVFSLYTYGSSTLNAWIVNGEFTSDSDPGNKIFPGDNFMTVGSPSTAYNVFSIGAFTTKLSWTDINGAPFQVDGTITDRAYFSSIGPTRDGRIKPDFSAPGHWIAAGNSKDANYDNELLLNNITVHLQGTSMASPHFTGVVALLLEQNPNLTYEEVFTILQNSAVVDGITGAVPNNEFGYGRIDAYAALQSIITSVDDDNSVPFEFSLLQNYPNPFNPSTVIEYSIPINELVQIKIYDMLGKEITTLVNELKSPGTYRAEFDSKNLSSGVYFYRITAGSFQDVRKMILLR